MAVKTKKKSKRVTDIPRSRAVVPVEKDAAPDDIYRAMDSYVHAGLARLTGGASPYSAVQAWSDWILHTSRAPGRQAELFKRGVENSLKLASFMAQTATGQTPAPPFQAKDYDHRFVHKGWSAAPFSVWSQSFLAAQDWWQFAARPLPGLSKQDSDRVGFALRQLLDTVSPSNFPLMNPEIIEETKRTHGRNLIEGAEHLAKDAVHTLTQERKPAPKGYEIGKDIACTPGEVVFRNEIFELIQYAPQTEAVIAEPVLIVPAWIMKYYVLDLSPHNSLINHLVGEGFTVFAISWVNPSRDQAELSLDDYRTGGVMQAIDVIGEIVPDQRIHANGYCLGGTMLGIVAATMARDGDDRLASATLMAAQLDFLEAGELLLFLDESQVAFLEDMMRDQGYLDRPQMARAFAAIRSEDLIYSRAVRRYLLGKEDMPTDLGVWNGDTTRMPARMHGEYLRSLFLENRLTAGRFAVGGRVIALKDIDVPMFVLGTETDHIAPWRSVYKTALFTVNDLTFVLTSSGHNGGILSEPGHPGRHYRIGHREAGANYMSPDTWLEAHDPVDGSWWPEWVTWLRAQSSGEVPARPTRAGEASLGLAPGTYIFLA